MDPLYGVDAGEDPLREPIHAAAANASAEEALRQGRASQDAVSAYASRLATAAAPAPRDHAHFAAEEEWEGATLRQRRAAASSRPTSPASPRRPRRRRGSTARRGCGAARSSTPTGRASLDGPESPLPGDGRSPGMRLGEDDLRGCCCVRGRLPSDVCVGDGVKDLAGTLLQRAGDDDDGTGDGAEDRAGQRLSTHVDTTSVGVLIGTPGDGGAVVREKAATDVFLAYPDCRHGFMARHRFAIKLGPIYWVDQFIDWVKWTWKGCPSERDPIEVVSWSWLGVVGDPIVQHDGTCSICGTLVCLEARHRLDFERRHGFKTFPYRIPAQTVQVLKDLCVKRRVWTPTTGAYKQEVLRVIKDTGGCSVPGVPGWNPCKLQVKSWKRHANSARNPILHRQIAKLIHKEGPLLGGLMVDDDYEAPGSEDQVYRGVPSGYKGGDRHCVVCAGYLFDFEPKPTAQRLRRERHRHRHDKSDTRRRTETLDGEEFEVLVLVVDNQDLDIPFRWILATVFYDFVEVHVEPLDATQLRVDEPSLWRRLLGTVRRFLR